jgi:hypothetical protein
MTMIHILSSIHSYSPISNTQPNSQYNTYIIVVIITSYHYPKSLFPPFFLIILIKYCKLYTFSFKVLQPCVSQDTNPIPFSNLDTVPKFSCYSPNTSSSNHILACNGWKPQKIQTTHRIGGHPSVPSSPMGGVS